MVCFTLLPLNQINPDSKELWGNKGASLARMYQAGLPVPPAYIHPALPIKAMPWYQLWDILDEFGEVAVRSSGQYSMPGMMETRLGVKNSLGIIDATIEVKQSAFSDRCLWYKKEKGYPEHLETAIIIQKHLRTDNDKSGVGVAFSANPLTGEHSLMGDFVRNPESGHVVVLGEINPESIWRMPRNWLHQLQDATQFIENLFGYPQDIEFLIVNRELWIVQSRDMKFAKGIKYEA